MLTELRNRSEIEFAVVTVETTGGQPIFDYSLDVARGWGIGPKDSSKGGGLLLMLAVKDRQCRGAAADPNALRADEESWEDDSEDNSDAPSSPREG